VVVVVKALPRRKFRAMVAAHPARDGEREDDALGVDADAFPETLLSFVDDMDASVRTIVAPEFANRAAIEAFLDSLSDADFNRLFRAAFVLNRVPADDPKDLLAYEQISESDETLS
jgi:hypothetical protein